MDIQTLRQQLQIGDIVFIHVDILPFRKISRDTQSWVNHVGIIIEAKNGEPMVAESTFPFSKATPLTKFTKRSKAYRVAIKRLRQPLTPEQQDRIKEAAKKRMWRLYDTGFNLHSRKQFCSRYVHEVVHEATGIALGKVESLGSLFSDNPNADLWFWRIWYFGRIPWKRETVTPASVLKSADLQTVFEGHVLLN